MADVKFVKPKNINGHFVKIKCRDCGNVQVVFARPSSTVTCNICGATIAKPTGGILATSGEVVEVL
ncbi:ribosomal protein S27 related protein [Thermoplasma acidophilum]|uniref:Small ribosomal subunit protein eS27 n=1 Tax=Thermoplasma acidophilum (strain ATCC 25905 / DSM 1728 / JCM 9062 / NBRC 15155 / AMRC-C165) TaxID=273075 RepID=RS27_THEAC|nr:30S ribosomal protein S27e [Thermoplasma acidophilum]Q9HIX2.1 RecName: Full=Small ribosomal subunit protein eS27; AltName: Full=30S ribosomal protein S27e [Thermoplasma acidophilum DSM 1728]MCY0852161.1 30S ribosomal protein S27e [Thermoplasma acidophilum]CAC12329.1 ribosomal protein S27 related protein [Thermoplasma acidophilum]